MPTDLDPIHWKRKWNFKKNETSDGSQKIECQIRRLRRKIPSKHCD